MALPHKMAIILWPQIIDVISPYVLVEMCDEKAQTTVKSIISQVQQCFSALTLLVGWQEGHPACKNWVVRYWRGYLSGARCKWFAYGPADATVTPSSLAPVKSRMVYLSGTGLPRLSWKKRRNMDAVVVVVVQQCQVLCTHTHAILMDIHRVNLS